jgi:hypothetical protein
MGQLARLDEWAKPPVGEQAMEYRLVAIGRTPDGKVQLLDGGQNVYELTKDSAWDDLNAVIDDPDIPLPEPVQSAAAGVAAPGEGINFMEKLTTELYGPLAGALFRNGAVGVLHLINRARG